MKSVLYIFTFFIAFSMQAQSKYEEGMKKAFELWGQGKDSEASAMFERIAAAEKNNWLPNYYVALVNTTASFKTKDRAQVSALLDKAQKALDIEFDKQPLNSELLVLQALIYTGWVAFDPMTYAMKYSAQVTDLYDKAQKADPTNPRAVFGKAEYEMGGAKYFGSDTAPMCAEVKRSIDLFGKFKPETPFHPKWGLDRAIETLKDCKQ
ncbi:hypothetical protein [Flavobacterium silvaticum]|uniref:Tetratricopeptide repeat protein n=1 Tax=Flavobacterium silvaticum TaxID=1852020 RepID=A0A972FX34_9FLAO|nr:hypothetical protein [Flavobacterium silvaticum]NMH29240.1 hypothetical protein [Flavobacterium silvaticum]